VLCYNGGEVVLAAVVLLPQAGEAAEQRHTVAAAVTELQAKRP
jgi:hypothetical protein